MSTEDIKQIYTPTMHANERARLRFGIATDRVTDWVNELMAKAQPVSKTKKNNQVTYAYNDVILVVDIETKHIITIYSKVSTAFLRPALEREIRKIKRESTRNIRSTEKRLAIVYTELAERMTNYVNARNPNTRELIKERVQQKQSQINDLMRSIDQQKDDAQTKIRTIELISK